MKYTTYIFDFDFTLADASTGIVASANYALDQLGFQAKGRDEIRKTVGMTLQDMFSALTSVQDNQLAEQFVVHFVHMADKIMTDNTILFDDTIDVLRRLKKANCKTAIVTTKCHYRIDEALKKYNIADLIDCIIGFQDVDAAKPSPEGLLKAIAYLGVAESSVLYIGDSLIDANTAKRASIDFAAVTTGTTPANAFQQLSHVYIVSSLTELMEQVNPAV